MSTPLVELIPSRPAVQTESPTTLDLLLRITPPPPVGDAKRPPLNLGLVLDRSGSMGERNKITHARQAAAFVVQELTATDRVSVTTFDDRIETIAPNAPVTDKARLVELIKGVTPRGSTALHGGWQEGAVQVRGHLVAGGLNRVLLLSDGLANVGESRPDAIADHVHTLARAGVGTTTLGLGDEYNEDLLEAMARAGDGNYYYVESPAQLPAIFAAELHGLSATVGTDVTLAIEPGPGAVLDEVLNELDRTADGHLKLPNLVAGMPVMVVVRLTVPAGSGGELVARFRLEWTAAKDTNRHSATTGLTLPAVPKAVWETLTVNADVFEQSAMLLAARAKKAATRASERGDFDALEYHLVEAGQALAMPCPSPEIEKEQKSVQDLKDLLARGQTDKFRKHAKFEAYKRNHSRS